MNEYVKIPNAKGLIINITFIYSQNCQVYDLVLQVYISGENSQIWKGTQYIKFV